MTKRLANDLWEKITEALEEKLQMGILEQSRAVVKVELDGSELRLFVATEEALEFFSAHVNQQRLIILSRSIHPLEKISVTKVEASPSSGR